MSRSATEWDRDLDRRPVKTSFSLGFWIIMIVLGLGAIGGMGAWGLNILSQPGRILTKTLDADNVIYNYEYFRDKYAAIEGMQPQIANVQAERDALAETYGAPATWSSDTQALHAKLSAQLTGLTNTRIRMIQEYNGNASKANKSIFLAGLPDNIPL
jgi:hypothetical protein